MKKLFLILVFLIPISNLFSTPDQSNWGRFIFIGDNENNYFCYFISRNYPGIYFDYTDSIFICKYSSNSGLLEEKHLLSVTIHKDTSSYNHWVHITNTSNFNAEQYLKEYKVWFKFPSTELNDCQFTFEEGNLFLKKLSKSYVISKKERNIECLKKIVDNTRWYNIEMLKEYFYFFDEKAKVVEYYKNDQYYFFIISIGTDNIDSNYFQYIVPIPASDITRAKEELDKI